MIFTDHTILIKNTIVITGNANVVVIVFVNCFSLFRGCLFHVDQVFHEGDHKIVPNIDFMLISSKRMWICCKIFSKVDTKSHTKVT